MNAEQRYVWLYRPVVFVAALTPLLWLIARGTGLAPDSLGANPIREALHVLGRTALNLLWITLCASPLRELSGSLLPLRLRRMLGLFAFGYAVLHFAVYAGLDLGLNLSRLGAELAKRPYILVGSLALLLLSPLAVTSTRRMMRRLGGHWQTLHRLIYPAALLAVWHFAWQVKADVTQPVWYAAALALLLGWRAWNARRRRQLRGATTSTSAPATAPERT